MSLTVDDSPMPLSGRTRPDRSARNSTLIRSTFICVRFVSATIGGRPDLADDTGAIKVLLQLPTDTVAAVSRAGNFRSPSGYSRRMIPLFSTETNEANACEISLGGATAGKKGMTNNP